MTIGMQSISLKSIMSLVGSLRIHLKEGIEQTVQWYLNHQEWCENVTSGKYQRERLGI